MKPDEKKKPEPKKDKVKVEKLVTPPPEVKIEKEVTKVPIVDLELDESDESDGKSLVESYEEDISKGSNKSF